MQAGDDRADHQYLGGWIGQLDRPARLGGKAVREPGAGGARFDGFTGRARCQRLSQHRVEQDARPFGAHRKLDLAVAAFRADIEPPAPHQRVPGQQGEIEQQFDGALRQLAVADDPAELDPPLRSEDARERRFGFMRVDVFTETAGGAEREAEEFELVGGGASAL